MDRRGPAHGNPFREAKHRDIARACIHDRAPRRSPRGMSRRLPGVWEARVGCAGERIRGRVSIPASRAADGARSAQRKTVGDTQVQDEHPWPGDQRRPRKAGAALARARVSEADVRSIAEGAAIRPKARRRRGSTSCCISRRPGHDSGPVRRVSAEGCHRQSGDRRESAPRRRGVCARPMASCRMSQFGPLGVIRCEIHEIHTGRNPDPRA